MASKITIIGAGSVGATIAFTLSQESYVSKIVLIDILKDKAEGEAIDIAQGTAFRDPVKIYSGDYPDAEGSDIVIITSGVARKAGQSRIDLAQINVNIMKSIAPELKKYAPNALYIVVANPVDIMTYAFIRFSGIPENQVIGSGTMLDTARLRYGLSDRLKIAQRNIHAYVFGEHGDTSFIPWSIANIACVPLAEYEGFKKETCSSFAGLDHEEVLNYVHKSGAEIIKRKGATFYGVTIAVKEIVHKLLADSDSAATVSTLMHGEYGIEDVCLSCISIIGPDGVKGRVEVKLTEEEVAKMKKSAESLRSVIDNLHMEL